MRVQTYRQKVNNGPVAKRRNRPAARAKSGNARYRSSGGQGRRRNDQNQGGKVFWGLVLIGAVVASGFVFALRSQINVYKLGQAETQLRAELDEISSRQRFETLDQQRAQNLSESERAARQAGLVQPRFNQPVPIKSQPAPPAKNRRERGAGRR